MVDCTLRQMELSGFRSFSAARVDFENPTLIVGQNGSGKSNFADVFAFLSEAMVRPLSDVIERRGGFSAVCLRTSERVRPASPTLRLELANLDEDTPRAHYFIGLRSRRDHGFEVASESCLVERSDGTQDSFNRQARGKSTRWTCSTKSIAPAVEANALALPLVGGDKRFSIIFLFLANMRTYRIEPMAIRAMQNPSGGTGLKADGGNVANVLHEIRRKSPDQDWPQICELLETVVSGTVDVQPKKCGDKLILEFTQRQKGVAPIKLEASSMSDGSLRALGFITAAFQCPKPSLLLIEDPEASIHPTAMGTIIDVLRLASRSMQVVAITHSPELLDAEWIEDRHLRILSWEHGRSWLNCVSQAVRTALNQNLMGAGELLRSNALTAGQQAKPTVHLHSSPAANRRI